MAAALVALLGFFVALYLTLYKLGVIGTLACGADSASSCEYVQTSAWATFLGLPVAAWGVGYYAVVVVLSLALVQDRWARSRGVSLAFLALTAWGMLFSAWLTYLELFVIHAICRWCVVSAVLAVILFALALYDWRSTGYHLRRGEPSPDGLQSTR
jgi:uncharacterized membrane protein